MECRYDWIRFGKNTIFHTLLMQNEEYTLLFIVILGSKFPFPSSFLQQQQQKAHAQFFLYDRILSTKKSVKCKLTHFSTANNGDIYQPHHRAENNNNNNNDDHPKKK